MIWALLSLHAAVVVLVAIAPARWGRAVFSVAAVPPALTFLWVVGVLGGETSPTAEVVWVQGLDLVIGFRVDHLSALMTLLVSGIGVLVFVYSAGYFAPGATGLSRFAATLLGFSTAMVGLVWAETVWTLFVFWELTSITSFLLVGFKNTEPSARLAARRALVITVAGGLCLLAGFVVLTDSGVSTRLSGLRPATGASATAAAVLVLVAAATKSAQVPFHMWLPGAMAAPTPVSAYLHSATMVKAGVLLTAVAAPALAEVPVWKPLGLTFGVASMIWGAVGALRQLDAKLILAWGTISQLGLMIALLSLGQAKATFAALALVLAHGVFKATLFMVVGEIDIRTGTRDISRLWGLRRSMPATFWATLISAASMAGVPLLLGFPAKEAAIEAVLKLEGTERLAVAGLVIMGSVLTVAYTTRLVLGMFSSGPEPTPVGAPRRPMTWVAGILAAASVMGYLALGAVTPIVRRAAVEIDPGAEAYSLLRWPGLTGAFVASVAIVALGAALGASLAARVGAWSAPRPLGARVVDVAIDGVAVVARKVTARVQHGSLPVYVATMAATAALAATPFVTSLDVDAIYRWDSPLQAVLGALTVAAAAAAARVGSRLGAALGLGAVGFGVAGLFATQGAPDLALTQLLVETVVVVGFVAGLGALSRRFPPSARVWRGTRLVVATLIGTTVAVGLAATASSPTGRPPLEALSDAAVAEGGGNNVVNVILTDTRALDTLGEVVVLMVITVGILALARVSTTGERT